MALPESVQQASDYADAVEETLQQQHAPEPAQANEDVQGEPESESEKLRNRYASLRGKYDAEVPRLHHRNKELEEKLEALLKENESLRGEVAAKEQQTPYLTESDVESYGEDMVDLVRRGAREESARYVKQAADMNARLERLQQQVEAQARDSGADRHSAFITQLTQEVPDWETQNTDEGFLDWLEKSDPVYGFQRNEALQRAYQAMDAHKVASIFKQYRVEKGTNPLARQVTPARAHARLETNDGQRVWTQQMIKGFYEAWRHGDISDEQAQQIEREIDAAVANGQVTD